MTQQSPSGTPAGAFKSCFSAVAAYLGRPSAETVLFAGVPVPDEIEIAEIQHLAERVGLDASAFHHSDFARGRFDLPVILFRLNGPPVALLSESDDGSRYTTGPQQNGETTITRSELASGAGSRA